MPYPEWMRRLLVSVMALPACAHSALFTRVVALDLDQLRSGLANDGNYHCVPTVAMNIFAHAGSNGYPGLKITHLNHNGVTDRLQKLGTYMDVEVGGTTMASAHEGGLKYLQEYDPNNFWVSFSVGPNVGIRFAELTGLFRLGAFVAFGYGRYTRPFVAGKWSRRGGHMVLMTGFDDAAERKLQIHDPGVDEGNDPLRLFKQSEVQKHLDVAKDVALPLESGGVRRVIRYYRHNEANDALNLAGIDVMLVYWPVPVATIDPLRPTNLVLRWPKNVLNVGGSFIPNVRRYETGGEILDFAFVPGLPYLVYLLKGSSKLFVLNLATSAVTQVAGLVNPRRLATGGRDASIFVTDANGIAKIHPITRQLVRFETKTLIDAIGFDRSLQLLVAFVGGAKRILFLNDNMKLTANLAAPVPASWPAGRTTLIVKSERAAVSDGSQGVVGLDFLLAREGSSILRRLRGSTSTPSSALQPSDLNLPGLQSATGLTIDPKGRLVATLDQKLATFELTGGTASSLFNNLVSRGAVAFPASTNAFDGNIEKREDWRYFLPWISRK